MKIKNYIKILVIIVMLMILCETSCYAAYSSEISSENVFSENSIASDVTIEVPLISRATGLIIRIVTFVTTVIGWGCIIMTIFNIVKKNKGKAVFYVIIRYIFFVYIWYFGFDKKF